MTGSCDPKLINQMLSVIASRGPDGQKQTSEVGFHFGFARLAINDLSETGDQPMFSSDGQVVTMLNGEIYNAPELRRELETKGYRFRGNSDAEVIPHGYTEWGNSLFPRLRGMFAIAVFEKATRTLTLVRDHFGIKPLYYATIKSGVAFASSARAVSLHPEVGQSLDHSVLSEFVRFRYVQSGKSPYQKVMTLLPGHMLVSNDAGTALHRYWNRPRFTESSTSTVDESIEKFQQTLMASVKRELLSDVPLGVLLSGGIDSGSVLFAAHAEGASDLLAFTYDMRGNASEVSQAREIANRYGAHHKVVARYDSDFHQTYVSAVQCMDLPVGDAIIAPTYQLLKAVSHDRKVVLTGEGADELMAGYAHVKPLRLLGSIVRAGVPPAVLATALRYVPSNILDYFFPYEAALGASGKTKVVSIVNSSRNPSEAIARATSIFDVDDISWGTHLPQHPEITTSEDLSLASLIDWGFDSWLPNQILNKMDQLSMAHGVEARVPFVDVDLYECVATLPSNLLLSRSENKRVLRETLREAGYMHPNTPKRAFFQPVSNNHLDELSVLATEWLTKRVIKKHGIFKPEFVAGIWSRVLQGDFLASKQVATIAALHIWLEQDFSR
jgi:asparagine synthase (glutamine-hydrolysing)